MNRGRKEKEGQEKESIEYRGQKKKIEGKGRREK